MTMFEYFEQCKKGLPIPTNWVDTSDLCNACPSYEVKIKDEIYNIWVDHKNVNYRDFFECGSRFAICRFEDYENFDLDYNSHYQTENFDELLNFINNLS
jgi:hypothetical protein